MNKKGVMNWIMGSLIFLKVAVVVGVLGLISGFSFKLIETTAVIFFVTSVGIHIIKKPNININVRRKNKNE